MENIKFELRSIHILMFLPTEICSRNWVEKYFIKVSSIICCQIINKLINNLFKKKHTPFGHIYKQQKKTGALNNYFF